MNVVDIVLVVAMLVFAVTGWRRGFMYGLLSLAGFLLGAAFGMWLAPKLVDHWGPGFGAATVAAVTVFICAAAGQVLVGLVGKRLREAVVWKPAVKLDAAGGAVLAVVSFLLVAWFVADVFVHANRSSLARDIRTSHVLGFVDQLMPPAADNVTAELKTLWNGSGFPDVFAGLRPEPVKPVGMPDAGILKRPTVKHSMSQTVKIVGSASCNRQLEGSGFAFAPDRVLTNAHVVAGVDRPLVFVSGTGEGLPATVVYFDPELDLAVLAVPGLQADPLRFEYSVSTGDDVAVVGYPEDGPLTGVPGRVRSVQKASGHNIYDRGTVVREILSLRATVRPGNSGGPVLDSRGEVVGIIFASSLDHAQTGYAMSSDQVSGAVSAGVTATQSVDTGRCT